MIGLAKVCVESFKLRLLVSFLKGAVLISNSLSCQIITQPGGVIVMAGKHVGLESIGLMD
jgi:hypothetical protein